MSVRSSILPDEALFADFRKQCLATDNWINKYDHNGMQVWVEVPASKKHKIHKIKCKMTIKDVSAATMYDVLHDSQYRKEWDPAMLESYDIARLSPNADVGYYSWLCPKPIKNRDVVSLRSWQVMDDEYIIINFSVKHPVMKSVHKAGQNYPAWKQQNSPDQKPWLYPEQNTLPMMDAAELSIQRADSLENVDESSKGDSDDSS
ncbi:START domain-containing protein 10 [Larimichthys crocea]|uniref:Uncharacterized protein n=1 Tax=Larimichthys crocea TaxID=215358 RepID=A0ACD3RGQ6_LARCR|nr:START domain-containing protein 10 [Larimichthys crocea]